jgi:hypothetical protein
MKKRHCAPEPVGRLNRWDRYKQLEEWQGDLDAAVQEAVTYHHHNQSAKAQADLWEAVALIARKISHAAWAEAANTDHAPSAQKEEPTDG